MRKICFLLCCMFVSVAFMGCNSSSGSNKNAQEVIPAGYTRAQVDDPTGAKLIGISTEFDPHFFSQNVTRTNGPSEEDWDVVVRRVKAMKVHRFRVMLLPEWLEPLNDNDDPDTINWDALTPESVEMKSLYKVLDLAEEEGIIVNLTLWGANRTAALIDMTTQNKMGPIHFLAENNTSTNWTVGPKNEEEFAENFSMFVQLLINEKGYTCIKEITPINEPSWTYQIDGKVDFNGYAKLCTVLHERFKADNIRDKVLFNLSDDAENKNWLQQSVNAVNITNDEQPEDIADMWNSHTYQFGYKTPNSTISSWQRSLTNIVRDTGKPHTVGEFGSNENVGSTRQRDIDTYERGVLLVRQMLNFFNAGSSGVSYWVLNDLYYKRGGSYSEMMQLGLWRLKKDDYKSEQYYNELKEDYEVRPMYYAYSLMTKYIRPDAAIYPIELVDEFVAGTAFTNPDGKWVYAFANGGTESAKLALRNGENFGSFDVYSYEEDKLPEDDSLIVSDKSVDFVNKTIAFELAANTVVLLVQK